MTYQEFKQKAFELALAAGCTAAEAYFMEGESFSAAVLNQEIESYSSSRPRALNLRVQLGGKNGYAYTEALEDPEALVARAMDNARAIENDDDHPMQGKCDYAPIEKKTARANSLDERAKIDIALSLERAVRESDPRVQRAMRTLVGSGKSQTRIANTLGLDAVRDDATAFMFTVAVAGEGNEVKDGFAFRVGDGIFDVEGCAKEAGLDAVAQLGGAPVPAGKYRVLFLNRAMADLIEAFSPMFSADAAQKGLSLLNGKEGEMIAAPSITLMDDPLYPENPRAFDDEGVPSVSKAVIENGKLMTLLHNLKTAKKAGVQSTSNGGRGSVGSPVGVMPSNFYIKPGEADFESLVKALGNGVIITDVTGLHAGLNTVSGEFSLLASGRLVENGKVVRAVEQITVSGTFLSMMQSVEAVGSDLKFGMPGGAYIGSPSILVSSLMISGK